MFSSTGPHGNLDGMSDAFAPESFPIRPIENRSTRWRLRTRVLEFSALPAWMGILNVTPDSFSDGGQFVDEQRAFDQACELIEHGADIIDIGGESTRPYATPVTASEELDRVLPVVERLAKHTAVPISIDTSKAAVAEAAIAAGAEIINDVTGLEGDPEMLPLVVKSEAAVCAMHMQGTPQTMQDDPRYDDVVAEILAYLEARRDALLIAGVAADQICLDPGIGFGKTHEHNLQLMAGCQQFHALQSPLLVGHSRKGFLSKIVGVGHADRSAATLGAAIALAGQGVQVIRVHDVRPAREAVLAYAACGGMA